MSFRLHVVNASAADPLCVHAADELQRFIGELYPGSEAVPPDRADQADYAFVLETRPDPAADPAAEPEAYTIVASASPRGFGWAVRAATGRGVLMGVYGLLHQLGVAFGLSRNVVDALPEPPERRVRPGRDRPLARRRVGFNWHNFLSGCTGWDRRDWGRWIDQLARMRFNAVMVHAYGNNPMTAFRFRGRDKPVGWIANSAKGRDWGVQHFTDVRSIPGGEGLFDGPVFGSECSKVPDDERVDAVKAMMREAFAHAEQRGMGVNFSLDVATPAALPGELTGLLPPDAMIGGGVGAAPNPDHADGEDYYRCQVRSLLEDFPQITALTLWFRQSFFAQDLNPVMSLRPEQLPDAWRDELSEIVSRDPRLALEKATAYTFFLRKLSLAYRRLLDESGRGDVELGVGSWRMNWLESADAILPRGLVFYPLDYDVQFGEPDCRDRYRSVSRTGRPVVPVVWAHHDDHSYLGPPYVPFERFADKLAHAADDHGYAVIHWTTRPLDLYFMSLSRQVWRSSRNEPLDDTLDAFVADGPTIDLRYRFKRYLRQWLQGSPRFGRETTPDFLGGCRPWHCRSLVHESVRRVEHTGLAYVPVFYHLGAEVASMRYFELWERFLQVFFEHEAALESLDEWPREAAVAKLERLDPAVVLRAYRDTVMQGGPDRGEQGVFLLLAGCWLPFVVGQRQRYGIEPLRLSFAPTQHEPAAEGAHGAQTWHFDPSGRLWRVLGQQETGLTPQRLRDATPAGDDEVGGDVMDAGVRLDGPLELPLETFGFHGPLPRRRLRVTMHLAEPAEGAGLSVIDAQTGEPLYAVNVATDAIRPVIDLETGHETGKAFIRIEPVLSLRLAALEAHAIRA